MYLHHGPRYYKVVAPWLHPEPEKTSWTSRPIHCLLPQSRSSLQNLFYTELVRGFIFMEGGLIFFSSNISPLYSHTCCIDYVSSWTSKIYEIHLHDSTPWHHKVFAKYGSELDGASFRGSSVLPCHYRDQVEQPPRVTGLVNSRSMTGSQEECKLTVWLEA